MVYGGDMPEVGPAWLSAHVGYCPQENALWPFVTVREQLELFARLRGINAADSAEFINSGLSALNIDKFADRHFAALSGGTKRKVLHNYLFIFSHRMNLFLFQL